MKCVYLVVFLFSCMMVGCGKIDHIRRLRHRRQIMNPNHNELAISRIWIDKDGTIPSDCVELKSIPYHKKPIKCFLAGKSFYNQELDKSKSGMICPFGPVSRSTTGDDYIPSIDDDLPGYSTAVEVSFDSAIQRLYWYTDSGPIYERANDRVTVLLLTIENIMSRDWRDMFLRIEEISSDRYAEITNKELTENESIVVFNKQGIYIKSRGDKKFRGYLFGMKGNKA